MGVPVGEAEGRHVTLCECDQCGTEFETDETMSNGCPECNSYGYWIRDGTAENPEMPWRDD